MRRPRRYEQTAGTSNDVPDGCAGEQQRGRKAGSVRRDADVRHVDNIVIAAADLTKGRLVCPCHLNIFLGFDTEERRIAVCQRWLAGDDERQMADRPRWINPHAVSVCSSHSTSAATASPADGGCTVALHRNGVLHQRPHSIWRPCFPRHRGGGSGGATAWDRHSHHGSGVVRRNVPCARHWCAHSKAARGSVYPRLRGRAPIWPAIRRRGSDPSPAVTARLQSFECGGSEDRMASGCRRARYTSSAS